MTDETPERDLSRDFLNERCASHLLVAGGTRPDLKVVEIDGRRLVLKDYHNSDALFRVVVGPILIRRECGALRKLAGVEGVPCLVRWMDKWALLMDCIDGVPMQELPTDTLQLDFYENLRGVIRRMHAAGVAHCDLRTGGNVLVSSDGRPHLIDFASSVFRGRGLNPITRWLFNQFAASDLFAVTVLKMKYSPSLLTQDDHSRLEHRSPLERPAIFIGKTVRKIVRRTLARRS